MQSFLNIEADAFSKKRESEAKIFLTPYGIGNNKVWFRSWSINGCDWVHKCSEYLVNLLNSNISTHILHTVRFTFPLVRIRRICLTIKAAKVGDHFLYSHDVNEWFSSVTVGRNKMLVTLTVLRFDCIRFLNTGASVNFTIKFQVTSLIISIDKFNLSVLV